ncbi:N-acetyltransferase [Ectothiorhodospiraceae bacterium 2226]|nr:N-acetyltransferase [Ectothiorhodospiraceae bacterium 2226]
MQLTVCKRLDEVAAPAWNALNPHGNPFLRHEFLCALERHGCLGPRYGWLPHHLLVHDDGGRLIGAAPLYAKTNSYGEFVFDWAWADAYAREGLAYYPKLVGAAPYTPATGPRLLVHPEAARGAVVDALIDGALALARDLRASSAHWLFTNRDDTEHLVATRGFLPRLGCQFHWENRGYSDFEAFLAALSADKRKKLRRERRRVAEQGVELTTLQGAQIEPEHWAVFHRFYTQTFDRKGGVPTLSRAFFEAVAHDMPEAVVLVLASFRGRYIAGALSFAGGGVLYGRHWGAEADFHSLHFEACYYRGIDYCISQGLQRFEPGAQGEHKVSRGFLPTRTWSAHWIAHPAFGHALADYVQREREAMEQYMAELGRHSPYRQAD